MSVKPESLDSEPKAVWLTGTIRIILYSNVDVTDGELDAAEQAGHQSEQWWFGELGYLLLLGLSLCFPSSWICILLRKFGLILLVLFLSLLVSLLLPCLFGFLFRLALLLFELSLQSFDNVMHIRNVRQRII